MPDRLADAKCYAQASVNSFLLNSAENIDMDIRSIRINNLKDVIRAKADSAAGQPGSPGFFSPPIY